MPTPDLPGTPGLLWRGATLACGVCGRRGLFTRWVTLAERCPRCGIVFERVEGHYIGAVGINTVLTFALMLAGLGVLIAATYPDLPGGWWVIGGSLAFGLVPVFFYPFSKTLWNAIDLAMRPLEDDEVKPVEDWTG